jgi:SAM-dependent methyltransferase
MQGCAACDSHYTPGRHRLWRRSLLAPDTAPSVCRELGQSTFHYKNMSIDDRSLQTDRSHLTQVQYRTDANLAARQSIYAYQRRLTDLTSAVVGLAGLAGGETVADIGCGNGPYLAELARRGHAGRILGADLSAGMLTAARGRAPASGLVLADAARLPLADGVADVTLAPHMLYHVPDRRAAAREFRRITRPGGLTLVVLNASDHLAELQDLADAAAAEIDPDAGPVFAELRTEGPGLNLDAGARLLASEFEIAERHDFVGELVVPGPQPVLDYVASMRFTQLLARPDELVSAVAMRLPAGEFRIRTHCGALVCR